MDTKTRPSDFKIQEDYEVIGQGGMIQTPGQVGEWWVTPAQEYKGKIPPEIQKKLFEFLSRRVEIQGLLIAEDMRVVEAKEKQEKEKKEANKKVVATGLGALLVPLVGLGLGLVYLIGALIAYDPMLIAVLDDGRWICLGTWFE